MKIKSALIGLTIGAVAATAAYAATQTLTLGTSTGPGGIITLFGSTSGSATIQTAAAAGTGTLFQLPANNGTNNFVLNTDGSGVTSWAAAGAGNAVLSANQTWTGINTFGSVIAAPTTISAAGALDLSPTSAICGKLVLYTGTTGTLTIPNTGTPGCNVGVTAASTGLATIAVTGGTFHSNTACTATPRTKEAGSTLWVAVQSNGGTAPVINVSGDCG